MVSTLRQLQDLKEWAQDSTRYERRLAFRGGQLVQPGPGDRGLKGKVLENRIGFMNQAQKIKNLKKKL